MNGQSKNEIIRDHLAKLARDGKLTAEQVVADARSKKSPIHDEFEWDDAKAAHSHRIEQARSLIASVKVEFVRDFQTFSAPQYVRDPRVLAREQGYVNTVILSDDKTVARNALLNEADRAQSYLNRVRALSVALDLESEVDEIVDRLSAFREQVAAA